MNIYAMMVELAACVVAQLEADGLTPPCWAGVVPGQQVVADFFPECEVDGRDGMVWARMATPYPAFQPGQIVEDPAESWVAPLGVDVELGILRSLPLPEEGLTPEESAVVTENQIKDMYAIRKAVLCCAAFERGDFLLNQYAPLGPLGGIVGGAWTLMAHRLD